MTLTPRLRVSHFPLGLRPFRLAVSRLDATAFIDTDVTDFLVRVRKLVSIARDFDPEWSLFKWPITNYQDSVLRYRPNHRSCVLCIQTQEHTTGKRMIMNFLDLEAEGSDDGEESDGSLTDESDDTDVAHKFEERAKQDRAATIEGYSDSADPLVRAIDVGAAPLYMFSIPPSTEIEFLHFLTEKCTSAYSAFTPSLGSGIIYVETPSIALLQKDLKAYLGSYRIRRKPNALEIPESVETLKMPPAIEHVGRFRRLRYRQQQLEAGDLVFATAPQVFLAIPRISYGPHEGHGPIPQALFDNEKFTKFCNGRVHDRRNDLVLVDKGRLVYQRNGLQRVDWQESHWRHMFIDGVTTPSDMELELFAAAKDVRMSTAPSLETYSALDNGDRVVGVHGRHEGRTGRICAVWTRNESSSSKRRRWAVVQDEEAFKVQLAVPYRNKQVSDYFCAKISDLRPHVPATSRPIQVGDRIKVVDGEMLLGESAAVVDCFCTGLVEVRTNGDTTGESVVLNLTDVTLDMNVGDVVRLSRGPMSGAVGMIVGFLKDGSVSFFLATTPEFAALHLHVQTFGFCGERGHIGHCTAFQCATISRRLVRVFAKHRAQHYEQIHNEWLEEMYTGKGSLKHVVERYSQKPLWEYKLMRSFDTGVVSMQENAGLRSSECVPIPSGPSDPLSAAVDVQLTRTSDLETTGDWLTMPKLAGKRIDVKLLGMSTTRFPKHAPPRSMVYENGTGYMVPFKTPLQSGMFTRQNFKVQLDGSRKSIGVPADAIRPCRQNPDGSSIDSTKCRVIIVGPDVDGNKLYVGEYAEVIPGNTAEPLVAWLKDAGFSIAKGQTQNVRVRIVRESDRRRATRMVAALVMIRKIEVDGEPARLPFTGVLVPIEDGDPLDGEIQSRKPRTISRHASDDTSGMELHGEAVHIVVDTAHEVEGQWVMRMNSHPNYRRD
ncbi:hypothetical protein B0H12DRAFT_1077355 [Mycena haematopus]|nr:hypothetical protein B0H12DRAFT_1077355 [Mycena haematopus]